MNSMKGSRRTSMIIAVMAKGSIMLVVALADPLARPECCKDARMFGGGSVVWCETAWT